MRNRIIWLAIAVITFLGLLGLAYGCVQCPDPCSEVPVEVMAQPDIRKEVLKVNANRGGGNGYGSLTSAAIYGELVAVELEYRGSISTTTDVTVSCGSPAWGNILINTDSATDAVFYPYTQPINSTKTAYTNSYVRHLVDGTLTVNVAQTQLFTPSVTVTLYYMR